VDECRCGRPAVYHGSGGRLTCGDHLSEWLRSQVFAELKKFIKSSDSLAVAASGGKDSTALLEMVHDWNCERNNPLPLKAILIDEGITGYREFTRKFLEKFCEFHDIPLTVVTFRESLGSNLDSIMKRRKDSQVSSCTICGAFRRYLLNRVAREAGATKLLLAHNLDDEVQTLLMNLFTGNVGQAGRKGELSETPDDLFVPRFKPLIRVPEKALTIHGLLHYPSLPDRECPYLRESLRYEMRLMANEYETLHPGFKLKLINTYLRDILPALQKTPPKSGGNLQKCECCGEPASQLICKTCQLRQTLGLKAPDA